jgi:hypothetical protein
MMDGWMEELESGKFSKKEDLSLIGSTASLLSG